MGPLPGPWGLWTTLLPKPLGRAALFSPSACSVPLAGVGSLWSPKISCSARLTLSIAGPLAWGQMNGAPPPPAPRPLPAQSRIDTNYPRSWQTCQREPGEKLRLHWERQALKTKVFSARNFMGRKAVSGLRGPVVHHGRGSSGKRGEAPRRLEEPLLLGVVSLPRASEDHAKVLGD